MSEQSPSPALQKFIDKTLRVTTTDTRMFVGQLKCTDKDKNLILGQTNEFRRPSDAELNNGQAVEGKVRATLKSRHIGLIVVPGEFIVKIEVDEGNNWGGMESMTLDLDRRCLR